MANIDFSNTPITIKLAYTKPEGYDQIATAPGGYNSGTVVIKDNTITGFAFRGYKTNNEIFVKSGQDITFEAQSAGEAAHFRNYAKVEGVTVTINDTVVDPADVADFNDVIDDMKDVTVEKTTDDTPESEETPDNGEEETSEDDEEGEGQVPDEVNTESEETTESEFSVDPTELSVVKGESATATIANATGEVTAESDKPSISAEVEDTTVTVTANANAAASATITLTDESGNTATIAVTTTD